MEISPSKLPFFSFAVDDEWDNGYLSVSVPEGYHTIEAEGADFLFFCVEEEYIYENPWETMVNYDMEVIAYFMPS